MLDWACCTIWTLHCITLRGCSIWGLYPISYLAWRGWVSLYGVYIKVPTLHCVASMIPNQTWAKACLHTVPMSRALTERAKTLLGDSVFCFKFLSGTHKHKDLHDPTRLFQDMVLV